MLNLLRNKKGDINFITGMILMLGGFVVITLVIMGFSNSSSDREAETLCKTSVDMRARTQINVDGIFDSKIKPIPTMCKTIDRKVYGSREQIKEQIAYSMARCWWMFGEGRYEEILKESDMGVLPPAFWSDDWKNGCFNCYTILVDEDKIEGGPITSKEFYDYVYEHKHPDYSNITYLDYMQYYGGPGKITMLTPEIAAKEAYAISFTPKNIKDGTEVGGIVKSVASGVFLGLGLGIGGLCIFVTAGGCAPLVIAGAAVSTGAGVLIGESGYQEFNKAIYSERDTSTIMFGYLSIAQQNCGSSDIAGK